MKKYPTITKENIHEYEHLFPKHLTEDDKQRLRVHLIQRYKRGGEFTKAVQKRGEEAVKENISRVMYLKFAN